jgi:hypothetical protein
MIHRKVGEDLTDDASALRHQTIRRGSYIYLLAFGASEVTAQASFRMKHWQ